MALAEAWFCTQWPIFSLFLRVVLGLLYGWKIQTWPIIRFLTVSHLLIFYLLVFDRIHDIMCQSKMSRTCIKNTAVYFIVHMGYFYPCVQQTHQFLVSSDHRSQSHFNFQSCLNMLEFVFGWAKIIFLETLPNNMWLCRCCLTFFF